ncbi:MAG: glycosyltransferase family 4 protein [Chloroflexota bacterium]|nr:glycosyltransferase family 4 protein [Chloroflexota bacterium]
MPVRAARTLTARLPARADAGPLRVLMVTPHSPLEHGGVERHVMEVSRRLVKRDVEVVVLCGDSTGNAVGEHHHEGVTIRAVRAWPARRDYYLAPGVWREIARETWDIIHIQSYHTLVTPLAMIRALTLGIPYVVTFHGGGHSSPLRNRMRGAQRRAMRQLFARASKLIATARFEIEEYGRELRLPAESFVLIPNGSDLMPGLVPVRARETGDALLASIGRLERYKGHHRVIAALPHVLKARPDVRLLIIGTGPYEPTLRRMAVDLGVASDVEFTQISPSDRKGMVDALRRISLVVLLSDFETHPMVALEAAAVGRPLLVAGRAGLSALAEDGIARAVAPDDPPEAIARAIVEELEHPRIAKASRLTSWDECTAALLELYERVR